MWGAGAKGRLGLGDTERRLIPTQVPCDALGDGAAHMVACGGAHSAAVTIDGRLFVWGWNRYGQCGVETSGADVLWPRWVPSEQLGGASVLMVSCGQAHTLVTAQVTLAHARAAPATRAPADAGGVAARAGQEKTGPSTVWAWGRGSAGQLGHGHTDDDVSISDVSISVVKGGWSSQRGVRMVACGNEHTALVTGDAHQFSWSFSCAAGRLRHQILLTGRMKQVAANSSESNHATSHHLSQIRPGKLWL